MDQNRDIFQYDFLIQKFHENFDFRPHNLEHFGSRNIVWAPSVRKGHPKCHPGFRVGFRASHACYTHINPMRCLKDRFSGGLRLLEKHNPARPLHSLRARFMVTLRLSEAFFDETLTLRNIRWQLIDVLCQKILYIVWWI